MKGEQSFTDRVRAAARELGAGRESFSAGDLFDRVGVQTFREKKRAYNTAGELVKTGELKRVSQGLYALAKREEKPPQKKAIMWRYLRMARTVTVEDLQMMADVRESYASEWLRMLAGQGIVREHGNGNYQLMRDPVAEPRDEAKAQRLRELRRKRRAAEMAFVHAMHDAACRICGQLEELTTALSEEEAEDSHTE